MQTIFIVNLLIYYVTFIDGSSHMDNLEEKQETNIVEIRTRNDFLNSKSNQSAVSLNNPVMMVKPKRNNQTHLNVNGVRLSNNNKYNILSCYECKDNHYRKDKFANDPYVTFLKKEFDALRINIWNYWITDAEARTSVEWVSFFVPMFFRDIGFSILKIMFLSILQIASPSLFTTITSFSLFG